MSVQLQTRGYPIIPFKNRKRVFRGRMFTEPKVKKHMEQLAELFELQLLAILTTGDAATWTGAQRQLWIQFNLPDDDCWTCVPELIVRGDLVDNPHDVGVDVTIEPCP